MRARLTVFLVAALLLGGVSALVSTEERPGDNDTGSRIVLVHADGTSGDYNEGVKIYVGNVLFTHRDASLAADFARYDSRTGETLLHGGATFVDTLRTLSADTLVYYDRTRESLAIGHVEALENDRSVRADKIRYRRRLNTIEALGGVIVVDDSLEATLEGSGAVFNDSTGYGIVTGMPRLMKTDADGGIITITCPDTIEVDRPARLIRLWENVVMSKDSISTSSDRALYDQEAETVTLHGEPIIRYSSLDRRDEARAMLLTRSRIRGDTITVALSERQITGARALGNASSISESSDSLGVLFDRSIIRSALMRLELDNRTISRITAEGTARSWYFRSKYGESEMFVNKADGDTLTFRFDRGELVSMKIVGYGGGLGTGNYLQFEPIKEPAPVDSTSVPTGVADTDSPESRGTQ